MDINQRAVLIVFLGMIAASGAARLYDKAGQPFWHALVPGLNLVALMRIVGRPDTHALWVLVGRQISMFFAFFEFFTFS